MQGHANLMAELYKLFLLGEEAHHFLIILDGTETTGVVGNAGIDTAQFEREDGLVEVFLEVVLKGGDKNLLGTPCVADTESVEHEGDGEGTERLVVD